MYKKIITLSLLASISLLNIVNANNDDKIKNTVNAFCETNYIWLAEYSEVENILQEISDTKWIRNKIDKKDAELSSKGFTNFKINIEQINILICESNMTDNDKYNNILTLQKYLNDRIQILENYGYANILYSVLTDNKIKEQVVKFYKWRWDENSINSLTKSNYNIIKKDFNLNYSKFLKYKDNKVIKNILNYIEVNNIYNVSEKISDNFYSSFSWELNKYNININKIMSSKWVTLNSLINKTNKQFPWKWLNLLNNLSKEEINKYKKSSVSIFITSWTRIKWLTDKYTWKKTLEEIASKYNDSSNSYLFVCINKNCFVRNVDNLQLYEKISIK